MTVDLSTLAAPDVIEALSFEAILAEAKADLIERYPSIESTIDLESEPVLKLLEVSAYRELKLRARYNDEARSLLLALATGNDLDHIGVTYYDEARLTVTAADTSTTPPTAAAMESDDDYRYRLSLKPESYSVAGPRDAYTFHALSADGQVKSVKPTRKEAGTAEIFILARTGDGVPNAALLAAVSDTLNDESIRPLTEEVIVTAGSIVNYSLDIGLILFPGATAEVAINAAVADLATYASEHHLLGKDIIRSAIDAAAHNAGVKEVIIKSPAANIVCADYQAPYCNGITVTIDGIES